MYDTYIDFEPLTLIQKIDEIEAIPKDIIIGCAAQFTIMPLIAFILGEIFGLEAGLPAGVILVGTCPGGTSSNVITYLLLNTTVEVDMLNMFISIRSCNLSCKCIIFRACDGNCSWGNFFSLA